MRCQQGAKFKSWKRLTPLLSARQALWVFSTQKPPSARRKEPGRIHYSQMSSGTFYRSWNRPSASFRKHRRTKTKKENSTSAWKRRIHRRMSMQEKRGGDVIFRLLMKMVVTKFPVAAVVVVFEIKAAGTAVVVEEIQPT